ncbi:uncharacterized protein LOC124924945 [Impatiens glandulifera]|uniref:uncharacterized protein LOC124924945 n=1 Tax=Impatiens glandulifera TaxID=253017 RepID=UPI001FB18B65|nr:uncharacterized protein LOC124924945 [Impatiens glandulifera]
MSSHLFQLSTLSLFPEEAGDVMKKKKRLIGEDDDDLNMPRDDSNDQRPMKKPKILSLVCWEEQTSTIKSSIQLLPLLDKMSQTMAMGILHEQQQQDPHLEEEEEVSTLLKLSTSFSSDTITKEEENVDGNHHHPWTITKKLFKSDVDSSSRLLLKKKEIESHVIPYLKEEEVKSLMFGSPEGIRIGILDVQKQQGFTLTLKKWKTGSFVFTSNWRKDFVKRRGLLHRDEIGLYFDQHNRRLCFGVLHKAPPHALPAWPV